jgi:hypothetical protein
VKPWFIIMSVAASLAAGPVPEAKASNPEVVFPSRVVHSDRALNLHSATVLKALGLFRVYSIGLYLEEGGQAGQVLEDVPKRLDVEYLRNVPASKLAELSREHMAKTQSPALLEELSERLETINAGYRDFAPGDRCALTYIPGQGTELSINGEVQCLVPGSDFARAYFSMWLGDQPLDEGLRDRLLRPPRPL